MYIPRTPLHKWGLEESSGMFSLITGLHKGHLPKQCMGIISVKEKDLSLKYNNLQVRLE